MLPLSSLMRDTFFTMLSCIRDCWFSFTWWISCRFRSSTDCTCRNPLFRVAHTSGSQSSASSNSPSDSPVVVLTVVVVAAGWWRRWFFLERRWLEGSSMVESAAEQDEFICCAWNTETTQPSLVALDIANLLWLNEGGQCYIYTALQGQTCYSSKLHRFISVFYNLKK